MRHLTEHERGVISLALVTSADRWRDMGDNIEQRAPGVGEAVLRQAAYARQLSNDVINAKGVVIL